MISWNVVWPALYVFEELQDFWFLVFATIGIETLAIMALMKFSMLKSFFASTVGNLVSGLVGSFIMIWVMLLWHITIDSFLPNATFDKTNWIATYILMCLGSVLIETLAVQFAFKNSFKRLFIPLLVGNLLTYSFIAYKMIEESKTENHKTRTEKVYYEPTPNKFTLLDETWMTLYTGKADIEFDKDNKLIKDEHCIEVIFEQEISDNFQFEMRLVGSEYSSGIETGRKLLRVNELSDTIRVVLDQKNPTHGVGWKKPIVTDTINFIKRP